MSIAFNEACITENIMPKYTENTSLINNLKLQNNKISVSIVKNYIRYEFTFFSVYYESKCVNINSVEDDESWNFRGFLRAKHFNVKNPIKSMFVTICNAYFIIKFKIQMICFIISQKLITVYPVLKTDQNLRHENAFILKNIIL